MKKFMQKRLKNEKGMTLIELLAVIVILAIIAAIAIPAIGNIIENSRYSAIKSDASNIMSAADIYYADGNTGATVTTTQLNAAGYLEDAGSFASATVTKAVIGTSDANISGDAIVGNVELTFKNATRDHIAKISKENVPIDTDAIVAK